MIEPQKYYRLAVAAEACGVKRTTLASAIERKEIESVLLGCELPVVKLADVEKWAKQTRKRGRPPKKAKK